MHFPSTLPGFPVDFDVKINADSTQKSLRIPSQNPLCEHKKRRSPMKTKGHSVKPVARHIPQRFSQYPNRYHGQRQIYKT